MKDDREFKPNHELIWREWFAEDHEVIYDEWYKVSWFERRWNLFVEWLRRTFRS